MTQHHKSEFASFNAVNNAGDRRFDEEEAAKEQYRLPGVPSKAAIQGHPVHPILVTMPIALLFTASVADWIGASRRDRFWARTSRWLIGAGLVTGAMAAGAGFVDFLLIKRVRSVKDGWIHMLGNITALILSWLNWRMRAAHAVQAPMAGRLLSRWFVKSCVKVRDGSWAWKYAGT